ncbi:Hypothetical predicted protein [Octopus vulgaris]|uniref:Uncharacterized protein n=1 Tax=Octopus vulgaris TaxID=6645 RepID=A0AA36AV06_OCTVU|nr:Hypothetical predicted protein [Octopus vulgaris]
MYFTESCFIQQGYSSDVNAASEMQLTAFWHPFCGRLSCVQNVVNDVAKSFSGNLQSLSYDFSCNTAVLKNHDVHSVSFVLSGHRSWPS